MEQLKPIKLGVMGFENGHAYWLYRACRNEPMIEVVACAFGPRERIIHENRLGEDAFNGVECYYDEEQMLNEHPEIEACICAGSNDKHMKEFRLLVWLTQLGLSVALPLAGFLLLGLWLHIGLGWGVWTVFAGLILGLSSAVRGFLDSLKAMEQMSGSKKKQDPPPVAFNHHD